MNLSIIKDLRKERKLSQKDLGNLLGVSGAYIQQIENNKTTPSINTLHKIADVLEVPVSRILDGSPHNMNNSISEFMELIIKNSSSLQNSSLYLCDNFTYLNARAIEDVYKLQLLNLSQQISSLEEQISYQEEVIANKDFLIESQTKFLDSSNLFIENSLSTINNLRSKLERLLESIQNEKDNK